MSWCFWNSSFIPGNRQVLGVEVSSNEIKTSQLDWMKNRCASVIFTCTNRDTSATDLFIHLALFLTSNWRVYEFRCQCIGRISRMLRKTLKVGILEIVCFHLQKNTKNCLIPHQHLPGKENILSWKVSLI